MVYALIREDDGIEEETVSLTRAKDDMYRLCSLRNHSSILVSAQELVGLYYLLNEFLPEFQEKAKR